VSKKADSIMEKLEHSKSFIRFIFFNLNFIEIKKAKNDDEQYKTEKYVKNAIELSSNLIEAGKISDARQVLNRCIEFISDETKQPNYIHLFKINNGLAFLEDTQENI
jgi:hypothetical protein